MSKATTGDDGTDAVAKTPPARKPHRAKNWKPNVRKPGRAALGLNRKGEPKKDTGRPSHDPIEDPELVTGLKGEDLSWVPADMNKPEHKEAMREMLRVYLACKITHKGVNDIDRMQIIEFGRTLARKNRMAVLAQASYDKKDMPQYLKYSRVANMCLSAMRQLLRDMRLLRATGLKIKTSTPTSGWDGLI